MEPTNNSVFAQQDNGKEATPVDVLLIDEPTRPPTANFAATCAAKLLKGLVKGEVTYQAAMGGAKLVDAMARSHANKINLLKYTSKAAPKSLLKEMSLDV